MSSTLVSGLRECEIRALHEASSLRSEMKQIREVSATKTRLEEEQEHLEAVDNAPSADATKEVQKPRKPKEVEYKSTKL
jgi:hypothetical protein